MKLSDEQLAKLEELVSAAKILGHREEAYHLSNGRRGEIQAAEDELDRAESEFILSIESPS